MTELQIQESQATFTQGESIRRLTIVNMIYLPATFIAVSIRIHSPPVEFIEANLGEQTVFGMQVAENSDSSPWHIWSFVIVSLAFTILTLGPAAYRFEKRRSGRAAGNETEASWLSKACRAIFPYRAVRVGVVKSLQQPPSEV
ncbi:hypothetical protein GGTG_06920 [Gaeumannomyces tritici R3-111a-1]|uniref:Uncharacterized protein n=1 Tax=Gaeumannomyces tritici (strain R3-111a-1) TaxID=644352 RepID=J3P073_GAET3|nr:hypothetical protein GGTG_06920 [Gaeumannomyces tritici R3-111a-1]EJT77006.1 hypothetical protein GGTG_06920 [Gaeumannomyces tritici R3-111a-1]